MIRNGLLVPTSTSHLMALIIVPPHLFYLIIFKEPGIRLFKQLILLVLVLDHIRSKVITILGPHTY